MAHATTALILTDLDLRLQRSAWKLVAGFAKWQDPASSTPGADIVRVLVTRPEPAATRTAKRLRDMGHDPVLMPLSIARHLPEAISQTLSTGGTGLVVTSAEALRAVQLVETLDTTWKTRPLFAVGSATAEDALALGFVDVITGEGDGASLARVISRYRDASPFDDPLVYIAGNPRAPALEQALGNADIPFRICEGYQIEPIQPPLGEQLRILIDAKPDAVLHYSAESLRRFMALQAIMETPSLMTDIVPYCLSEAIAEKLPAELNVRAKIASDPSEESLLSLL